MARSRHAGSKTFLSSWFIPILVVDLLVAASPAPMRALPDQMESSDREESVPFSKGRNRPVALYPIDKRRAMSGEDYRRFPGAGVLFCRDPEGIPRKAAASWLVGSRRLVMMNAHNFRDRDGDQTRTIDTCFFQIGGKNYDFDPNSLKLGISSSAAKLHITDDWALAELERPVDPSIEPQPMPKAPSLATGGESVAITMVSPAGHANFRGPSSLESCAIREIDPPSEDDIRRVRHDCNDGFGGSGSGLFDEAGHLVAMQSASLDMNRRLAFDIGLHYGSALLIEGKLLQAIDQAVNKAP